jgi:vacuolar-type H+-ATPase subunit E/Vma4
VLPQKSLEEVGEEVLQWADQRKAEMQKRQQEHLDKMSKDLNLSSEQVKKVKALIIVIKKLLKGQQEKHFQ